MIAKKTDYQVKFVNIRDVKPSPENDQIYNGVNQERDDFKELVKSIRQDGIKEPLHVTLDGFILSGHRRFAAATRVGLSEIPVIQQPVERSTMRVSDYRKLLADYNTQRVKTGGERVREQMARSKPKAHQQIIAERLEIGRNIVGNLITTDGSIKRSQIGPNLQEFLNAVIKLANGAKADWPISSRSIHYWLLDIQPLTNSSNGKQRHRYANDEKSTGKLSDILTRARIAGLIPMHAIMDETRSEMVWDVHDSVDRYTTKLVDEFTARYYRDLTADQPHHIEIVVEKNTVKRMAENVVMKYTIPVSVARGKCSLPPRAHVIKRWQASGKDKLILILMADHDPDGVVISDMWHKSLIGDFGIDPDKFVAIRAGLNKEQAERFKLPKSIDAKPSSPTYKKFVKKYGSQAYELDALKPNDFKLILRETIESVIDRPAYDAQVAIEEKEAGFLEVFQAELADFIAEQMDGFEIE